MSALQCSRAGCRAAAVWSVNWRNPRIHPQDRVKVWLACQAHREFLHDYLASRSFPVAVEALDSTSTEVSRNAATGLDGSQEYT